MNIVFHQGALGDWVLTFPILRALRPVYAVAPYSKANLAARLIDRIKPVGIEKTGFSQLYISGGNPSSQLGSSWCNILDDTTLIISFISNGDDAWAANIRELASRAHHVFIRPQPPSPYRKHVTDWYGTGNGWIFGRQGSWNLSPQKALRPEFTKNGVVVWNHVVNKRLGDIRMWSEE